MTVKFNAKEAQISQSILDTMESKLHLRLDKYFKSHKGEDTLFFVKLTEKKPVFTVELNVTYGGYKLRTEVADRNGALAALDKAMDTMERQITKCKERISRKGKAHRASAEMEPALADTESPAVEQAAYDDEEYRVVKVKIYEMKPMSTQEAILQMEFLGHNFYVFHNVDNRKVCTVYRRNDGDYGLIEPAD